MQSIRPDAGKQTRVERGAPVLASPAASPAAPSGSSSPRSGASAAPQRMADWSPASLTGAMGLDAGAPGGFDAAVAGEGTALPHRGRMEAAFGQDLGFVQAHTGAAAQLAPLGAQAAARGDQVAFAEAAPSPWLVAHELTHVMQSRGAAGGSEASAAPDAVAAKSSIASDDSAAEREADRVADRVSAGAPAGPISAAPGPGIQRFAPGAHEKATVKGLAKGFSADEIAAIYASNWERDFSQGHPDLASAAIAWAQVKQYAAKHGGKPGPTAQVFQDAIWRVVNGNIFKSTETSLGGYQTWEHMDAPDKASVREKANERWANQSAGVAGYIMDARAHIKDQMVAAIDVYRVAHKHAAIAPSIDNWGDAERPEGYVSPEGSTREAPALPQDFNSEAVASRDPIRGATRQQAVAAGATTRRKHDAVEWAVIGQHLGRAMHAFEDFWAHSNWLELAMSTLDGHGAASNEELFTGTFPQASQAHALGHKLLAMSRSFAKDHKLMLKVYGVEQASTKIDSDEARNRRSTRWAWNGGANDHALAYGALGTDSWSTLGEISDVGTATNNVEELVLSGEYTMADFLTNQNWLAALGRKGELLIAQGDTNSGPNSHGKIAKDQEEGDGHKDHESALRLATAANQMVFGPLRAIMDQKNAARALAATQKQLDLVDRMLVAPTPAHPLWSLVKSIHGARKKKAGKK